MDLIEVNSKGLYIQDLLDLAKSQIDKGLVKADYLGVRRRTFQALDELEVGWIRHSQLLPGAEALLSRLGGEGNDGPITLALLTNSGRAATTLRDGDARLREVLSEDLHEGRPPGDEAASRGHNGRAEGTAPGGERGPLRR